MYSLSGFIFVIYDLIASLDVSCLKKQACIFLTRSVLCNRSFDGPVPVTAFLRRMVLWRLPLLTVCHSPSFPTSMLDFDLSATLQECVDASSSFKLLDEGRLWLHGELAGVASRASGAIVAGGFGGRGACIRASASLAPLLVTVGRDPLLVLTGFDLRCWFAAIEGRPLLVVALQLLCRVHRGSGSLGVELLAGCLACTERVSLNFSKSVILSFNSLIFARTLSIFVSIGSKNFLITFSNVSIVDFAMV